MEAYTQALAVLQLTLDRLPLETRDNEYLANTRASQAADDMLENWTAMNPQHRFGNLAGEFLHAGAFSRGKNDGFHSVRFVNAGTIRKRSRNGK